MKTNNNFGDALIHIVAIVLICSVLKLTKSACECIYLADN